MITSVAQAKTPLLPSQTVTYTAVVSGLDQFNVALGGGRVYVKSPVGFGNLPLLEAVPSSLTSGVSVIAAGQGLAGAIKSNAVTMWGYDDGYGTITPPSSTQSNTSLLAIGTTYAYAKVGNNIVGWGYSGPSGDRFTFPTALTNNTTGLSKILASGMALKNGRVYLWANGANIQTPVETDSGVTDIAAGVSNNVSYCYAVKGGNLLRWDPAVGTAQTVLTGNVTRVFFGAGTLYLALQAGAIVGTALQDLPMPQEIATSVNITDISVGNGGTLFLYQGKIVGSGQNDGRFDFPY